MHVIGGDELLPHSECLKQAAKTGSNRLPFFTNTHSAADTLQFIQCSSSAIAQETTLAGHLNQYS